MKNLFRLLTLIFALSVCAPQALAQSNPSAPSRLRYVTALPATCNPATGEIAIKVSVSPTEYYWCDTTNHWSKLWTFGTQTANFLFAGPTSGGAATPAFRALVAADLPSTSVNSVVNDTNVTGSIGSQTLTLGFTGTLAKSRQHAATVYTDAANTFAEVTQTARQNNIQTTPTDGVILSNATASTSGVPVQYSPALKFSGRVWNTTATAADNTFDYRVLLLPTSGTTPTAKLSFQPSRAGAAYAERFYINSDGSIGIKPGSRAYTIDADDPSGAMRFGRSDVSGTYLTVIPASSNVSFNGVNATNNADFVFQLQGGKFVFTPAQAGGAGTIQFGRRYSDSSTAVGASSEFWPTSSQTTPVIASVAPGNSGGNSYRFKVMPSASTTIGLAADEVGLTIKGHSTQTSNLQEFRNTSNTLVASVSNAGVITADGSGLTALNSTNLASGSVPLGRLSGITTSQLSGSAGITNAQLANSSVTVNTGAGLSGGGAVSLGGSLSLARVTYAARATHNADQAIPDSMGTTIALNTEHHDTDSIHSTVTNNERLTAQRAGYYRITGTVTWAGAAGGTRTLYLRLNANDFLDIAETDAPGANRLTQKVTATYYLNASDYVDLRVVQTSGSTINIVWLGAFGSNYKNGPILEMEWVGP